MTAPKVRFTDSKDAVRWYTDRAGLLGISLAQIAKKMGVGRNYISMLRSPGNPARLPLDQIQVFVSACGMSDMEKFRLFWLRIKESDGEKGTIDMAIIRDFALAVRRLPHIPTT